jgi:hypothetical protein
VSSRGTHAEPTCKLCWTEVWRTALALSCEPLFQARSGRSGATRAHEENAVSAYMLDKRRDAAPYTLNEAPLAPGAERRLVGSCAKFASIRTFRGGLSRNDTM